MKVFIFDLDDTLYEEISYVHSGFRAVAEDMMHQAGIDADEFYLRLIDVLKSHGRGQVFDVTLDGYGLRTVAGVKRCISVYRAHKPNIELLDDVRKCLESLSDTPVYIVTDGNKNVQRHKLQALGLYDSPLIRKCFITRRYGIHNEKPSPYCFLRICKIESVQPHEVVYIGDNPHKDFVGIKPLGFRTVRVRRGAYSRITREPNFEAEITVRNLTDRGAYFNK